MSSRASSSAIDSPAYLGFEQKLWQVSFAIEN